MTNREEQMADEILTGYAKIIEKAQADEMDRLGGLDPDFEAKLAMIQENELFKPEKKRSPKKFLQIAAMVMLAVSVTVVAMPTTEVYAWAVWTFHAIFGGDDTHTTIDPVDENDYLKYYVSEIPEGFEIVDQQNTGGRERIIYANAEDKFISFQQLEKALYESDADEENRESRYEKIGDFEVRVSETETDCTFSIISDDLDTVIFVHTDAGFEVGKQFIEKLVKE